MANNKSGRTALITGASSGIGFELAKIFARHGWDLVLVARSQKKLQELARDLESHHGVSVTVMAKDLAIEAECDAVYEAIKNKGLFVEALVNNAGVGDHGPFHESEWSKDRTMIELNITALTKLTRLFLPDMISHQTGRVLNVASTAAFQPGPLMAIYYATKAYVLSFSEAIANELRDTGVTVTALCPGPTTSGFQAAANISELPLIKGRKIPSSKDVAEYAYEAMRRGQVVAIHGVVNTVLAQAVRFTPRSVAATLVRKLQEKR